MGDSEAASVFDRKARLRNRRISLQGNRQHICAQPTECAEGHHQRQALLRVVWI